MQGYDGRRAVYYDHGSSTGFVKKERGMNMECAGNGYAICVNGRFEHWYPDEDRAQSYFEFLRDMLPDTETVDLIDFLTGEVLASTMEWEQGD